MSRHDNYPDDIRMYDNDPRSPFYDDGGFEEFKEKLPGTLSDKEIAEILDEVEYSPDNIIFAEFYRATSEADPDAQLKAIDKIYNTITAYIEEWVDDNAGEKFKEACDDAAEAKAEYEAERIRSHYED